MSVGNVMLVFCPKCNRVKCHDGWKEANYDKVKLLGDLRERNITVNEIPQICPDCPHPKKK